MNIECMSCGASLEVDQKYIGQTAQCPACKNSFTIENPNVTSCPDCFRDVSKRAAACPHCGATLASTGGKAAEPIAKNVAGSKTPEKTLKTLHPCFVNYLIWVILGVLTIPFLFGIFILLYVFISIYCTTYKITDKRIIVTRGLLSKEQKEIWIADMRGTVLSQGIFQRLFGVGNIGIGTAATAGTEIQLVGIAQPQKIVDLINSLR